MIRFNDKFIYVAMIKTKFFLLLPISLIIFSSCANNQPLDLRTAEPTSTAVDKPPLTNQIFQENQTISPCDLVHESRWEALFGETPLFISEDNGSCLIENQWTTRSIWFSVFQGDQAFDALKWDTTQMISGMNDQSLDEMVEQILSDEKNNFLNTLFEARLPLFERLDYRWETVYTIGDKAYWFIYSQAFKGILDVIDGDRFFQIGFSGFSPALILSSLEDLTGEILAEIPKKFTIDFQVPEDASKPTPSQTSPINIPQIVNIKKTSQEIYFGDLCENELTTIRAELINNKFVDNVYLVYRLNSSQETNRNWNTVFMNEITPGNWEITLSAEKSFQAYKLVNGAYVEYSIAVIYNVNKVFRSQSFMDITVLQCQK